jgi:pimeloyl-ACP methyl ester carboxylesterase
MTTEPYLERRRAASRLHTLRGLRHHVLQWGDASLAGPDKPPLVMLHGWMDVGASFQFVVDAMADERLVWAPDWRGFGLSDTTPADTYWFPDYLGDLDALLDTLAPGQAVDLLGHSMGGNVAMLYAGVRPGRVRRLVNLEGFGMPQSQPHQAPKRYAQWLDELKTPPALRTYDGVDAVAERLRKTNPLLTAARAAWLAERWSRPRADGRREILGDPLHKRINPALYQKPEVLECWKRIEAPVMWVEGDRTDAPKWWGDRYPRADFESRLAVLARVERHVLSPAGHMLHHDQPERLAELVEAFLA